MNVYKADNYKDFIVAKIETAGNVRGYQKKMAEAAGCNGSFLSQALNSPVHLTPDHAAGLAQFWKMDASETEYFVGLVNLERAASGNLKGIYKKRLDEIRKGSQEISRRVATAQPLSQADEMKYYSSWIYGGIHVLVSIAKYQTPGAIAEHLRLPLNTVQTCLEDLERMRLLRRDKNLWRQTEKNIHLPKGSLLSVLHHTSWRQRAALEIQNAHPDSLIYTAVHSLSRKDIAKVKDVILECIEKTRKIIDPSPEEELVCFICDFFRVE